MKVCQVGRFDPIAVTMEEVRPYISQLRILLIDDGYNWPRSFQEVKNIKLLTDDGRRPTETNSNRSPE